MLWGPQNLLGSDDLSGARFWLQFGVLGENPLVSRAGS